MFGKKNRHAYWSGFLLCAFALGSLDTARAQSVTITTSGGQALSGPLSFSVAAGAVSAAQTLNVTTPPNNGNTIVVTIPEQYSSWLNVSPSVIPSTPGQLSVSVNATSLGAGTQSGTFTVAVQNNAATAQTITVSAAITGTSALTASPAALSFIAQAGQNFGTPQNCAVQNSASTCQVTILSSAGTLAYNVSMTPANSWLLTDQFSGSTGGVPMNVGVNASSLTPGTYTGQIQVQSKTTSDSVTIAVTLTVTANATLSAAPTSLTFYYTIGSTTPAAQQVTVSSSGAAVAFNVTQSANSSWLHVTPITSSASRSVPAALTVSVTPTSPVTLTPALYTATLTIGAATVNVSLVVSDNPFLTVTSNQLAFSAQFGGTAPPVQGITVGSTINGDTLNFSATATSSQSWLTVSPSGGATGTASAAVSVGISQSVLNTLPIGTYTGTVTIAPTNGDPYSIVIPVTLTVGASSSLFAAPSSLVFSYETSQLPPAAQTVELLTSGPNLGFTITTSVSGGTSCGTANWLSAVAQQSPLETPNTVIVSVNTAGMTTGSCFGTVRLAYTGASGPTETDVQVTLFVSTSSLLTISLPQGFGLDTSPVETSPGGGLIQHQIAIGSTDASALQYSVTYQSAPCAWLSAGPNTGGTSGTSPTPILVQILPGCITTPGNYSGSITISSPGLPTPVMFTLNLVVTSNVSVAVTPQSLTFNQSQGGPAPAAQTLSFTVSGGNAPFVATASSNFNWLAVTPASGSTSLGSISASVNTNTLPQGTYPGEITINFQNAETPSATIQVQLVVGAAQTLTVSPTSLTFSYQLGGSAPAAQNLTLTSTGGSVNFTVGTTSSGAWLAATPTSGSTGTSGSQTVSISVNPANIPAGTAAGASLTGSLSISAPSVLSAPTTIPVTLNITAVPAPAPSTISTSAVSNGYGAIAPGELITIKGTNLGPATGTSFTVNTSNNTVSSTLAGVQVTFDDIAGTPTYVSATQINVIVPWEIAGRTSTTVVVSYNSVPSAAISEQVVSVAPGIYTQNATGSGQAAALNLSSSATSEYNGPAGGTYSGTGTATAPAPAGSDIVLFLTGGGLTNPASVTGSINPSSAVPLANWTPGSSTVTATVGGQPATVLYAGAAPTLITGVVQINLQLPAGVSGSALPVVITIDGVMTTGGATVAVQ